MKNIIFKTRLVFTVLIFALAFAVPVSNTITEEVGITQTVNAKTKKKSKKPKKQGKVITVKKADQTTAKKIYTEGMKGKTFTIQYKCKSSSKKNISKGKKQLVKLCKSIDNYFPQFNNLGVNFKVTSALNIYKGDIKQSGKYVFVVINKGSENMDKFTCQRYALEVLPQLTSEWVQHKTEVYNEPLEVEYRAKDIQYIKDYEAGLIKEEGAYEKYVRSKSIVDKYNFDMAVIKAINEGKWINLDDPIRAYILSDTGTNHTIYSTAKRNEWYHTGGRISNYVTSHSKLLEMLHSGKTLEIVCGEYVHLHQTLWELTTFYNMDYYPVIKTTTDHATCICNFKVNSGRVVKFATSNGACSIVPSDSQFNGGFVVPDDNIELYELYPDLNNIWHN